MNIEEKVKMNLLIRGFDNKTQLNNRGLIGATIDETILEVVKNLRIADVISSGKFACPKCHDRGWLYDDLGNRAGTCPCHY